MPSKKRSRAAELEEESEDSDRSWQDEESDAAGFGKETRHFFERDSDAGPDEVETFKPSGKLRLRPDITLEGGEYSTQKSTRKEAFDEISDDEYDDDLDRPVYSDQDFDNEPMNRDAGMVDEDLEAVNREYEELQKEEEEMLKNLKGHNDVEIQKAKAVKLQKDLWDKVLDTRIALQKIVADANRLPQVKTNGASESQEAYNSLRSSLLRTLDSLLDLDTALVEQNPGILEACDKDSKLEKGQEAPIKTPEAAWERLHSSYTRFIPYRNRSLDKWHRKTQISSGAAASRAKLKAFNQSISQQVATAMKDPSRLIARMLTGGRSDSVSEQQLKNADNVTNAPNAESEAEVFDDSEFYQQLLREFLEASDPNGLGFDAVRKLRNKKRKVVDRRASKGRKIRYTVHEPLVNFMVPEPMSLPPMATKLFASLFGSKPARQEAAA